MYINATPFCRTANHTLLVVIGLLFYILLSLYPRTGSATVQWPVVTNMQIHITSSTSAEYTDIQWAVVNVSDEWRVPPKSVLSYGHRHNGELPYPGPGAQWRGETRYMWECRDAAGCDPWFLAGLPPKREEHSGSVNGSECVGARILPDHGTNHWWTESRGPAHSCLQTPPANEWCNITTPQITLDHGTLALEDAASHSANTPVSIECTTPMSISLILGDLTDTVKMTGGITSKLSVDNKPLGSVLNMNAGTQQVTLSDQLSAGPGGFAAGFYQGSAVLKLLYE